MERKREGEKPRTKGKGRRRFAKRDKEKTRNSPFFLPCPFQIAGYEHVLYSDHKVGESGRRKKKIETCHETRLFPLSGAALPTYPRLLPVQCFVTLSPASRFGVCPSWTPGVKREETYLFLKQVFSYFVHTFYCYCGTQNAFFVSHFLFTYCTGRYRITEHTVVTVVSQSCLLVSTYPFWQLFSAVPSLYQFAVTVCTIWFGSRSRLSPKTTMNRMSEKRRGESPAPAGNSPKAAVFEVRRKFDGANNPPTLSSTFRRKEEMGRKPIWVEKNCKAPSNTALPDYSVLWTHH